jgi:regulator of sigma E protease
MNQIMGMLGTFFDFLLVAVGFGMIVFIHELGHFVAARWAGIRVLTFSLGFGPAIGSYRKGLGIRRGSSEPEYESLLRRGMSTGVSPTEYRLNWLPLGGYVRMLGQEDLNPGAVSGDSDSYQRCKPWKRMVVISAGVVCNVILALVLFLVVFMAGLKTEPAMIGGVDPTSPAARAVAMNADELKVTRVGLQAGDVLEEINGTRPNRWNGMKPNSFNDLTIETAMSRRGEPINLAVRREGVAQTLNFQIVPRTGKVTGLQELGVAPSLSAKTLGAKKGSMNPGTRMALDRAGLVGFEPGMILKAVDGRAVETADAISNAMRDSNGAPVRLTFEASDGKRVESVIQPKATLQSALLSLGDDSKTVTPIDHLLGLQGVLRIENASPEGTKWKASDQGLRDGDIFARIGDVEYPSVAVGMWTIKSLKEKRVPVSVLRKDESGRLVEVAIEGGVQVNSEGRIGFSAGDSDDVETVLAAPVQSTTLESTTAVVGDQTGSRERELTPAAGVFTTPGSRIVDVAGTAVTNFTQVREALKASTAKARTMGAESATVPVLIRRPGLNGAEGVAETIAWTLSKAEIEVLHGLGWQPPFQLGGLFEMREITLKGQGPAAAVLMGVSETRRVMLSTYTTFLRLFQGTVKVEHLKGPVGIAHMGTILADRGFIWVLFFLAMISVNLAVINFLPLPIVDGGQFLLLVFEQVRGKPAPIGFQNAITMAGMLLMGSVFLVVTFNDLRHLFLN